MCFISPRRLLPDEKYQRRPLHADYRPFGTLSASVSVPFFHVSPEDREIGVSVQKASDAGMTESVFIEGHAGVGKTQFVKWFASEYARPMYTFLCGTVKSRRDWFGFRAQRDGNTTFVSTGLVEALETPRTVILFDELNRTDPENLAVLYSLLDDRRETRVPEIQELRENAMVRVARGVTFFFTANIGDRYVGTEEIDDAFRDRMDIEIELQEPDDPQKCHILTSRTGCCRAQAEILVAVQRKVNADLYSKEQICRRISLRQLLAAAQRLRTGTSVETACRVTIESKYPMARGREKSERFMVQMKIGETLSELEQERKRQAKRVV